MMRSSCCRLLVTPMTAAARGGGSLLPRTHIRTTSRFTAASTGCSNQQPIFSRRPQQQSFSSTTTMLTSTTPNTLSWLPVQRNVPPPVGIGYSGASVMNRMNNFSFLMPVFPQPMAQSSSLQQIRQKHSIKTNKSVSKRFRTRGNGSLKRAQSGRQHNTGKQSRSRSNRLGQSAVVSNKKQERKLKQLMGVF